MFLIDRLVSKMKMPTAQSAMPGRSEPLPTAKNHFVNGRALQGKMPSGFSKVYFGMGCFWGVEQFFWEKQGVWVTAVGYQAGFTPNPTYNEVCTGLTGHNETVQIIFDPKEIEFRTLLKLFWENHDPTQGMKQGNDKGTQYRSGIYVTTPQQRAEAEVSMKDYQLVLNAAGKSQITTEIQDARDFYFAEEYHQQYLAKNPDGYCNLKGLGIEYPALGNQPT